MEKAVQETRLGRKYYDENYSNYDKQNPQTKLEYYKKLVDRFAVEIAGRRKIYDLGCGLGNFLSSLGPEEQCFGSDINPFAIEQAQTKVPNGKFVSGPGAEKALFQNSPFPQFDVITSFDVLEHIPDLELAAKVLRSQLRDSGILIFVVPVYDGLSGPIIRRLDKDPTHVHKCTRQFWLDWAERHFQLVFWEGIVRYLLPNQSYLHLTTHVFRSHTPAISVVCKLRNG